MEAHSTVLKGFVSHKVRHATPQELDLAQAVCVVITPVCNRHRIDLITPADDLCPGDTCDTPSGELFELKVSQLLSADAVFHIDIGASGGVGLELALAKMAWIPIIGLRVGPSMTSRMIAGGPGMGAHWISARTVDEVGVKLEQLLNRERRNLFYRKLRRPRSQIVKEAGLTLRRHREKRGYSRAQLARELGVSTEEIKMVEEGTTLQNVVHLTAIGDVLHAQPGSLHDQTVDLTLQQEHCTRLSRYCVEHGLQHSEYLRITYALENFTGQIDDRTTDAHIESILVRL